MGNGNIVMYALRTLFRKIFCKYRIPETDKFSCIEKYVTKIARTAFLHMGITVVELT